MMEEKEDVHETFVPIEGKFVQILNCNDRHWICATTVACKHNVIKI